MTNPQVAIDITANDKSGKGVASAEKRLGTIPKHAGVANARMLADGERSVGRSSRGILRTLGSVEQASAKVFGGRSITSGLTSRLGALGEVASTTSSGLTSAASAGGLLEAAAGGVGVAVGATVGILAAAGYAAFKLADGWAKGAASIGRTAETIGVGTKALQEFVAAGERVGVDKGASTGTLGSLSQTLNDARYGRNSAALAILGRLGIGMKTKADGTADVEAMLPAIADGIARANSSGQRTAARGLGIGIDSLAMFRQGGKALSADMADADTHAVVIDQGGINTGKRIARKGAMVGQLTDLAMSRAGEATATAAEGGYDAVLKGGTALSDGAVSFGGIVKGTFAPAAEKIGHAAVKIEGAGEKLLLAARSFFEGKGWTRAQSAGIVASLHRESALRANAVGDSGHAYGIGQWHADRQANFARLFGHGIKSSTREEQLEFVHWELTHTEGRAGRKLRGTSTGYDAGAAISRFYERPADKEGEARQRGDDAAKLANVSEVRVDVHVTDQRVKATAKRKGGQPPAISVAHTGR